MEEIHVSVEIVLFEKLRGDAGIGALAGGRVYPKIAPQDAKYPCVTFFRVSRQVFSAFGADASVEKGRFQIDAWAKTYREATELREAIKTALQRWKDGASSPPLHDCFIISALDLYEDDAKIHHHVTDIELAYG
ncbi:MAG: DUF3168 domain-containing protein [Rickettsiales bacterium]